MWSSLPYRKQGLWITVGLFALFFITDYGGFAIFGVFMGIMTAICWRGNREHEEYEFKRKRELWWLEEEERKRKRERQIRESEHTNMSTEELGNLLVGPRDLLGPRNLSEKK